MSRTATPSVGPLSSYAMSSTLVRTRLRTARWLIACRSGLGLGCAVLLLPLARVIFGPARLRAWRGGVGVTRRRGGGGAPAHGSRARRGARLRAAAPRRRASARHAEARAARAA